MNRTTRGLQVGIGRAGPLAPHPSDGRHRSIREFEKRGFVAPPWGGASDPADRQQTWTRGLAKTHADPRPGPAGPSMGSVQGLQGGPRADLNPRSSVRWESR
jgi:hypothetical protein